MQRSTGGRHDLSCTAHQPRLFFGGQGNFALGSPLGPLLLSFFRIESHTGLLAQTAQLTAWPPDTTAQKPGRLHQPGSVLGVAQPVGEAHAEGRFQSCTVTLTEVVQLDDVVTDDLLAQALRQVTQVGLNAANGKVHPGELPGGVV